MCRTGVARHCPWCDSGAVDHTGWSPAATTMTRGCGNASLLLSWPPPGVCTVPPRVTSPSHQRFVDTVLQCSVDQWANLPAPPPPSQARTPLRAPPSLLASHEGSARSGGPATLESHRNEQGCERRKRDVEGEPRAGGRVAARGHQEGAEGCGERGESRGGACPWIRAAASRPVFAFEPRWVSHQAAHARTRAEGARRVVTVHPRWVHARR